MSNNFLCVAAFLMRRSIEPKKIQATCRMLGAPTHTAQGVHNTLIDRDRARLVENLEIFTNFQWTRIGDVSNIQTLIQNRRFKGKSNI